MVWLGSNATAQRLFLLGQDDHPIGGAAETCECARPRLGSFSVHFDRFASRDLSLSLNLTYLAITPPVGNGLGGAPS